MQLKDDEFGFSRDIHGNVDGIIISKKALEEWRDHYRNVAEKHSDEREFSKLYYVGMADVLTDILKYFEEE